MIDVFDSQKSSPWPRSLDRSLLECGQSVYCSLFFEGLSLVVNENNTDPTCRVFGSEPIRSVVVIRPNLIRHHLAGLLF